MKKLTISFIIIAWFSIEGAFPQDQKAFPVKEETYVFADPDTSYVVKAVDYLKKGEQATLLQLIKPKLWKVYYKDKIGYIKESAFEQSPEFKAFSTLFKPLIIDKTPAQRRAELIKKYGATNGALLAAGKIKLGMSKAMIIEVLDEPDKINRTVGSFGVHEQWVYSNRGEYYYFENGKLTSWQD